MKLPFEAATMIIDEQPSSLTAEVCIELDASAPLSVLNGIDINTVYGVQTAENAFADSRLSDDKQTMGFPIEVRLADLKDFCEAIRGIVPQQYFCGFSLSQYNEGIGAKSVVSAIETIFAHDFKAS